MSTLRAGIRRSASVSTAWLSCGRSTAATTPTNRRRQGTHAHSQRSPRRTHSAARSEARLLLAEGRRSLTSLLRTFCTDATRSEVVESTDAVDQTPAPSAKIPGLNEQIRDILSSDESALSYVGRTLRLSGWVRTVRSQKTFAFVEIADGSTLSTLQVIVQEDAVGGDLVKKGEIHTGAAVSVFGELVESPGGKQKVELRAKDLTLLGGADPADYPLQKKRHSLEFLRGIAHLRGRTNTFGAVMRVRSALCKATHDFFQLNGFHYIQTPIISGSDCEGAGEMFQVTTALSGVRPASENGNLRPSARPYDPTVDFFGQPSFLTVSGQLNAEAYACALSRVYTFGPTFRAENSNTSRHLAEFWMLEPEMAFCDLSQDISCAEAYLKYCITAILAHCSEDLALFDRFYQKGLLDRLESLSRSEFERISYTEAVDLLQRSGMDFEFPVDWGRDLQSEHERHLTEVVFRGKPVVVMDYPKDIKAFYMKLNADEKTVAAMDVLVPGVGELIGGSQREDDYEKLKSKIAASGLNVDDYWWYLDLRKYGSVPHSGFGLGFERFVQFVTGMENIRDVIPFPRYPGHCAF